MTRDQREAGLTQAEADAEINRCANDECENLTEPLHHKCRCCEDREYDEEVDAETEWRWENLTVRERVEVCQKAHFSIFAARSMNRPDDRGVKRQLQNL